MSVFRSLLTIPIRTEAIVTSGRAFVISGKNFSINTPLQYSYDPDGKTVVDILNNQENAPLMINSYSMFGFRLNNGIFAVGPIAIFPRSILSWNIKDDHGVDERSLSLFLHLAPKLDILIIGLSDARNQKLIIETRRKVYKMIKDFKKSERINIEVLPTEKAVTTFNFLNSESRFVGAALIPPTFYTPTMDDEYRAAYISKKLSKEDDEYIFPEKIPGKIT